MYLYCQPCNDGTTSVYFIAVLHLYRPHSEGMREGNAFTGVCPFTGGGGGVPQSHVLSLVSGPRSFLRGHPSPRFFLLSLVPGPFWGRGYPVPMGDTQWAVPWLGLGYPPPQLGLGYPPPPQRQYRRVLATRRTGHLLRSRGRTFLIFFNLGTLVLLPLRRSYYWSGDLPWSLLGRRLYFAFLQATPW